MSEQTPNPTPAPAPSSHDDGSLHTNYDGPLGSSTTIVLIAVVGIVAIVAIAGMIIYLSGCGCR